MTVAIIICGVDVLSLRVFLLHGHCLVISIVAGPSQVPANLLILYSAQKTKRQQNSKLAGPPPAHNPTPGHFSRSCPSPLLLLHLLLILQVKITAPSFEHSFPLPLFSY